MSKNEQHDEDSNIKSLSPGSGYNHTITDYNYMQSSENQRIVSLLLGHDQTIPTTMYESQRNWTSSAPLVHDNKSEVQNVVTNNLYLSSDTSVLEMIMNEPKYTAAYVPEVNNCKPNYPFMNDNISYFLQNNTNLC